ncbi:hypothetical protein CDD83_10901 [Cordyceps sp. RAO-2017]|nr:hypothetical protein CDD83_10901 [Cordyceps sp. RAO-2017]
MTLRDGSNVSAAASGCWLLSWPAGRGRGLRRACEPEASNELAGVGGVGRAVQEPGLPVSASGPCTLWLLRVDDGSDRNLRVSEMEAHATPPSGEFAGAEGTKLSRDALRGRRLGDCVHKLVNDTTSARRGGTRNHLPGPAEQVALQNAANACWTSNGTHDADLGCPDARRRRSWRRRRRGVDGALGWGLAFVRSCNLSPAHRLMTIPFDYDESERQIMASADTMQPSTRLSHRDPSTERHVRLDAEERPEKADGRSPDGGRGSLVVEYSNSRAAPLGEAGLVFEQPYDHVDVSWLCSLLGRRQDPHVEQGLGIAVVLSRERREGLSSQSLRREMTLIWQSGTASAKSPCVREKGPARRGPSSPPGLWRTSPLALVAPGRRWQGWLRAGDRFVDADRAAPSSLAAKIEVE